MAKYGLDKYHQNQTGKGSRQSPPFWWRRNPTLYRIIPKIDEISERPCADHVMIYKKNI